MSLDRKIAFTDAVGFIGVDTTRMIARRKRNFDWRNQRVAISARKEERSNGGAEELHRLGAKVIADPGDVGDRGKVFIHDDVFIHGLINVTIALQNRLPELTRESIDLATTGLPKMGKIKHDSAKGHESESLWSPSVLTTLTKQAEVANDGI